MRQQACCCRRWPTRWRRLPGRSSWRGRCGHGDGFEGAGKPTAQTQESWWKPGCELVEDGIDALAESYPENVELTAQFADGKARTAKLADMVSGKMNLQYFADGGDGGAGAAEGGAAEAAAPAVQEPALRPAQERLARRSGALKGKAAGGENSPAACGRQPLKEGASGSESDPAEAEKHQEPAKEPKAEKDPGGAPESLWRDGAGRIQRRVPGDDAAGH